MVANRRSLKRNFAVLLRTRANQCMAGLLHHAFFMRPIFEKWLEPFKDLGATTIALRNTGGTDHLSFDAVGLPGFQFIQDPLDYFTRTHHSNMDVYDRIQPADLEQASAIIASLVYNAATRPEKLPRKPLPKPRPPRPGEDAPPGTAPSVGMAGAPR